jgi:hypothetical protein
VGRRRVGRRRGVKEERCEGGEVGRKRGGIKEQERQRKNMGNIDLSGSLTWTLLLPLLHFHAPAP